MAGLDHLTSNRVRPGPSWDANDKFCEDNVYAGAGIVDYEETTVAYYGCGNQNQTGDGDIYVSIHPKYLFKNALIERDITVEGTHFATT